MGKEDTDRQALNVYRMELLGAKVHPVTSGTMTLKDAVNETMREWSNRVSGHPLCAGIRYGTASFPHDRKRFSELSSVKEAREQILEGRRKASGSRGGLCGRRQQCHGCVLQLY